VVTNGSEDGTRPADAGRVPSGPDPADAGSAGSGLADAAPAGSATASAGPASPAPPDGDEVPLLQLRGIGKNFGPVQALTGIDLDIPVGQVTALAGDNGAGKTTLIKCIAGIWPPSTGQMLWQGRPVSLHSPREASNLGIAAVYQDLALADNLDIVQNMLLGHEPQRFGLLDEVKMELTAKQTLSDLRVTTVRSIRQPVGSLSGGQRQAVAVAKAVILDAKLVIMDEPTAALGVTQTELVLSLITQLANRGHAVLVVSHNLTDVFRVADRVAVLYLGRLAAVGPVAEFDPQSVVDLMTTGTSTRLHNGSRDEAAASAVTAGSGGRPPQTPPLSAGLGEQPPQPPQNPPLSGSSEG
jgi:ABC-type sugar transport system ATPase subunit